MSVLAVIFFILIIVIIVFIILYFRTSGILPFGNITTPPIQNITPAPENIIPPTAISDCSVYAATVTPATCPTGDAPFGDICYKDVWSSMGGTKTAICTVDYGSYGGVYTECGIGIYYLNYGDPCPMVGPGYFKTAVCTCQLRGAITSSQYCQADGLQRTCPMDADSFQGSCYKAKCPDGYFRCGACSCCQS
jgi:hypothetical protein